MVGLFYFKLEYPVRFGRRVNFVGPVQPTPMQETEAFREGESVTDSGKISMYSWQTKFV